MFHRLRSRTVVSTGHARAEYNVLVQFGPTIQPKLCRGEQFMAGCDFFTGNNEKGLILLSYFSRIWRAVEMCRAVTPFFNV